MALRVASKIGIHGKRAPLRFSQTRAYSTPFVVNDKTKLTNLSSGLRIVTSTGQVSDVATVGVYIDSGSAYESDSNNGVSSVLKHLVSLGNPAQVAEIEKTGSKVTASTSREVTSVVAEGGKNSVPKFVSFLSDFVKTKNYTEAQIDLARKSIDVEKKALKMVNVCEDLAHSAAYQGTPYALSVFPEKKPLREMTPQTVHSFVDSNFTARRTVVVGAGDIDHDEFVKQVESAFAGLPSTAPVAVPIEFTGSEIRVRDDSLDHCFAYFGWETVGIDHPHFWTTLVLKELTGSWNVLAGGAPYYSPRLAETYTKEGMVSEYKTAYNAYKANGLFGIYASMEEGSCDDATYELFNEFQKMNSYLSPEELTRAKTLLISRVLQETQGPTNTASALAKMLLGSQSLLHPAEWVERIQSVEVKDIKAVLDTYFYDVDPVVIAYGRIGEFLDYNILRGWTYWNRW